MYMLRIFLLFVIVGKNIKMKNFSVATIPSDSLAVRFLYSGNNQVDDKVFPDGISRVRE